MIRVGFLIDYTEYVGGMNYIYNLIYAAKKADKNNEVEFVLFFGKNAERNIINRFEEYSTIIQTEFCDKKSLRWYLYKILFKFLNITYPISTLMGKNNIHILSHSSFYGKKLNFKTIEWLPDFQFIHLPYMFTRFERIRRERLYRGTIKYADALIVSSNDGKDDFDNFTDCNHNKLNILQFTAQPNNKIYQLDYNKKLMDKYKINKNFFYMPNQLWKHKNHLIVIEALKILKDKGLGMQVVCSGGLEDFRSPKFKKEIMDKIKDYELEDGIIFLGMIPYLDVQYLIRHSLSVINPSLFEGWSSTVEEVKSIGKNIILSNIRVHLEQDPPEALYFDPRNPCELSEKMEEFASKYSSAPNFNLEEKSKARLSVRTKIFGSKYLSIIKNVHNK